MRALNKTIMANAKRDRPKGTRLTRVPVRLFLFQSYPTKRCFFSPDR